MISNNFFFFLKLTFFFLMPLLFLSWYNAVFSSISLQAALQPKTKEDLKEWIKECDGGVKNHGEPNTWNVTLVTDMSQLFLEKKNFNAPIDQWNTSGVTTMYRMFRGALSFNQPITMDTSKVTNMDNMFDGATAMTHPVPISQAEAQKLAQEAAVSNFF